MENTNDLLSPDNTNEESILKSPPKNIDENGSINNSNNRVNLIDETSVNNLDIGLNNIDKNDKNVSKVSKCTQYKVYIPIVTFKIISPSFFMLKYIIYSYKNVEDQNYCKYSVLILTGFILFCYYLAVFSDSSQNKVDKYFVKATNFPQKSEVPGKEIHDINEYNWNDCRFCKIKKYMRTSHCRVCNKCVLMRDHHCPYIVNCVGFNNIQYFFNFVFWGDTGIIFYISSFINYRFFSEVKIHMPNFIKILLYFDIVLSAFFICNITGIMFKLLLVTYNNRTQKEEFVNGPVENYCPIFSRFSNFPKYVIAREPNYYNMGFLTNFYYLIGPTISHFFFPLPKFSKYNFVENCPVLKKIYYADRLDLFKLMVKIDPNKINLFNEPESSPDTYLENCHKYYDKKKIV